MTKKCDICGSEMQDYDKAFTLSVGLVNGWREDDETLLVFCQKCLGQRFFLGIPSKKEAV